MNGRESDRQGVGAALLGYLFQATRSLWPSVVVHVVNNVVSGFLI